MVSGQTLLHAAYTETVRASPGSNRSQVWWIRLSHGQVLALRSGSVAGNQGYDSVPVGETYLPIDQFALSVKDEECRHSHHAVTLGYLPPQRAKCAQPYHPGLSFQLPF